VFAYPEASNTVIFSSSWRIVLMFQAAGLFGTQVKHERVAFGLMVRSSCCALALYPVFPEEVMCFALFRLRVQPADRLRRLLSSATHVPRHRGLRRGVLGEAVGVPAELAILLATGAAAASAW